LTSNAFEADIQEFVQSGHIGPQKERIIADEGALEEFRQILDSTFPEGTAAPQK
jgi:hypothetical protein